MPPYPYLPRQEVKFSLFEPDWQVAQTRFDYVVRMTDSEIDSAHLMQVALRYEAEDLWDEIPCEAIDLTAKIAQRLLRDSLVWFRDEGRETWRQIEFGDLLRRETQRN